MESINEYKKEILKEIDDLSAEKMKEVLDFVYFIKTKELIDPSQAYFWTHDWQKMEKEVEENKKAKNIIGDGTVDGLLQEFKK